MLMKTVKAYVFTRVRETLMFTSEGRHQCSRGGRGGNNAPRGEGMSEGSPSGRERGRGDGGD